MSKTSRDNKNQKNNSFDQEIYGDNKQDLRTFIPTDQELELEENSLDRPKLTSKLQSYTAPKEAMEDIEAGDHNDPFKDSKMRIIAERQSSYHKRKTQRPLSPTHYDPFKDFDKAPDTNSRTYREIMMEQNLENEKQNLLKQQAKTQELAASKLNEKRDSVPGISNEKIRRTSDAMSVTSEHSKATKMTNKSDWDEIDKDAKWETAKEPRSSRWDRTPQHEQSPSAVKMKLGSNFLNKIVLSTPVRGQTATPRITTVRARQTPTPGPYTGTNKFEETPTNIQSGTDVNRATMATPTPTMGFNIPTPSPGILHSGLSPFGGMDKFSLINLEREQDERNRPLTNEELDQMLPSTGYEIVEPPEGYKPPSTPSRKLISTPYSQTPQYNIPESTGRPYEIPTTPTQNTATGIPSMKPDDVNYFSSLLNEVDETKLTVEELRDRRIMTLLLKIKNGTPPMRKSALRQITEKAREFGAGPLFNQILPLLMSPTLEDQERHLLVKVIDRVLFKLDELVRPYVHKILAVIEPLLIDEDYFARVEGREIISNLSKAAGLATMISTMRPDIDNSEEIVRNCTARAFAVVASALGIPALLPFLKAVCQSKKSWTARHTGIRIVQNIAILMGCSILPYLKNLVEIIENGLKDEQQKIRTQTALAISALAEASYPYGIDSFVNSNRYLFDGIKHYKGKALAAFLKAIGFIIPLMEPEPAGKYSRLVFTCLRREFGTPDEEMKKIILKVLKQCISTEGIEAAFVRSDILPDFFKYFWNRRMALDRKNYRQLIETTVELANKVGGSEIIEKIADGLKDENESFRKMILETIDKIVQMGVADVNLKLEQTIMDGLLFCFQEQISDESNVILNGFGNITNAFGLRAKSYIPQICGTIHWRLNNRSARVRQYAADLVTKIASVMKLCGEETLMGKLGVVLYEYLGEEYPEVLGSIIAALKAIVAVIGMTKMTPPIKDLLPRLTPILKNRHEKVQENVIDLVGRIADRGASFVSAKEWMRICFDLLEMLKATRKGIRRATINTFGYIAKAIGPQDVLVTLLNNLKVQERQNRVCTTVAIAIVAESCGPYTVLPALMNEYRVPELNVQNGVLKSLSFMFEYIGEMSKDYIYAVLPLLEDAFTDRDLVHRQIASNSVKHLALNCAGLNSEDALTHLLNFVWPNIFETSPHVINSILEAIEALRVGIGPNVIMRYVIQGLFHPARRVRDVFWKVYNILYVSAADALNATYPPLPDDFNNSYKRNELDLFI